MRTMFAVSSAEVAVGKDVRGGLSGCKRIGRVQTRRVGGVRMSAAVQEGAMGALGAELGVEIRPLHEDFGADIVNLDVKKGVSDAEGMLVKKALDVYKLVRIRGQDLSPDNLMEVMRHLPHDKEAYKKGESTNPLTAKIPGHPWLVHRAFNMEVKDYYGANQSESSGTEMFKDTRVWHMDQDFFSCPPEYSMMHMTTTPPRSGQTLFASTIKAYNMLSEEQKSQANKLIVESIPVPIILRLDINVLLKVKENGTELVDECLEAIKALVPEYQESVARNPLVVVDPENGERSFLTTPFRFLKFEGMGYEESRQILEQYLRPALLDGNVWAAEWEERDFVIWKNRQLIHSSVPWKEYDRMPRAFNLSFWQSDRPLKGIDE